MWNTTEKFLKQEIMVDKVKSFLTRGTYISLPPLRTRSFAKLSVKYAGGQTICTVFTNLLLKVNFLRSLSLFRAINDIISSACYIIRLGLYTCRSTFYRFSVDYFHGHTPWTWIGNVISRLISAGRLSRAVMCPLCANHQ